MSIVVGLAYAAGFVVAAAVLVYAVTAVIQTGRWYLRRREIVNAFAIQKGLSVQEVQERVPGVWQVWDSEWTDDGEVSRCGCTLEDGRVLSFYFLGGRLYSWHADTDPPDENLRD